VCRVCPLSHRVGQRHGTGRYHSSWICTDSNCDRRLCLIPRLIDSVRGLAYQSAGLHLFSYTCDVQCLCKGQLPRLPSECQCPDAYLSICFCTPAMLSVLQWPALSAALNDGVLMPICLCMFVCECVSVCVCVYVYFCIFVCVCSCVGVCVGVYTCAYIISYVYKYVYMYMSV